jgi:ubiquinone/menaquinone biosynthesis C-methylase UbiE
MRHPDGRGTTVPVHQGRDVAKGTLRGILSDDMLTLACANAAKAGAGNVEFRKGEIEALPLPAGSVTW